MILGLDFDNTIVSYDDLIFDTALDWGWIPGDMTRNKKTIRDHIRVTQDDIAWQKLQAYIYGPGMKQAKLMDDIAEVIQECHRREVPIFIVSHKTPFASMDEDQQYDLRDTARAWMQSQQFFNEDGLGLNPDHVYFEVTRDDKVKRVEALGCTHFVDDLEETFLENNFPPKTSKLLFTAEQETAVQDARIVSSWKKIYDALFTDACDG